MLRILLPSTTLSPTLLPILTRVRLDRKNRKREIPYELLRRTTAIPQGEVQRPRLMICKPSPSAT